MPNRNHHEAPYDRQHVRRERSYGYSQADFDRAQAAYAPEWRSYAQDWRDAPQQPLASANSWPRAEGYAQQRTDRGHRHESVFGDSTDSQRGPQYGQAHDEETLGQQLRHASHQVVNRVKRAFRGPKGYKRSDERIREDVNERLAQQDQIDPSEIEVRVENSEVTLSGTVHSRWDKFAAEEIADDVSGVEEVHNQLKVVRPSASAEAERTRSTAQAESLLRNRNINA